MWVIRTLRVPHDVLKEHLSSLWIQQCMRQLFKVDTVTISTTTSRSLNRLYVTTFKLTRSPSVQRRVMLKLIRLSCGVRVRFVFFSSPTAVQWHNFSRGKVHCACLFSPNIFRSPWNTHENFREYSLRLCVKTSVKFTDWVVTPIKTALKFSCNPAFYKLLFIIYFLNVLWNYGGKVFQRTHKFIPPHRHKARGEKGGDGTPP